MSEVFTAHAQYDDWKGTAAADNLDNLDLQTFFRSKGVPADGYVVAIRASHIPSDQGKLSIRAIYADGEGFDSVNDQIRSADTLQFKELDLDLTFEAFFSLFKRFNVVLADKDLGLADREYKIQNAR